MVIMEKSENIRQVDCVVLGAGLSGLTAAFELHKRNKSFVALEQAAIAGGMISSSKKDGFVIEYGPNSLVLTPEVKQLCKELHIEDQLLYAKPQSNIRQIIWNSRLHTLKPSPLTLVTTSLLSFTGKLRVLKELFINSKTTNGESVHAFFTRRLGKQAAERIAGAIVSGIYAGDPTKLEVAAIFSRLVDLEKEYGSVIKGLSKSEGPERTIVTFNNGLQTITDALRAVLGDSILFDTAITSIIKMPESQNWQITYSLNGSSYQVETAHIIATIPAYALNSIPGTAYPALDIAYNPMLTLQVAMPKKEFMEKTLGFGFLASTFERNDFIGVMLNGHIFETGLNDSEALMNFFVRPDNCSETDAQLIFETLCAPLFKQWTGIAAPLRLVSHKLWQQAIPQKTIGHVAWLQEVAKWEIENPGFYIAGNYKNGVALGDCVAHHQALVNAM
jgi:oxygen-dependent protoporphyrinogen oxidase